jgi:hypothetical protein
MQDRYAGDVGDFSKFALTRQLRRAIGGPIGIIWYRYPDESHTNDGRHIAYVHRHEWAACDPELVNLLRPIACSHARTIRALECAKVLPPDTRYFDECIHPQGQANWNRRDWFSRAKAAVAGCKLVVVDPDNGIAGPNHAPHSRKGGKHITHDEIRELTSRHECLVIYHHFDRSKSHPDQIQEKLDLLRNLAPNREPFALRYRPYSPRAYFLLVNPTSVAPVQALVKTMDEHPWNFHFGHSSSRR